MSVKATLEGNELVIRVPWDKQGKASGSGKNIVHATSGGNKETDLTVGDKKVVIGVFAYIKK